MAPWRAQTPGRTTNQQPQTNINRRSLLTPPYHRNQMIKYNTTAFYQLVAMSFLRRRLFSTVPGMNDA
ncbi:hypothetical protein T4B_9444 [Trichinella pseudospiralis]|uniref:Uncharacterized protein n=1 Tax=Trichinella pseudospiralis TaxID=6337 RepID=A0A0V1JID4_TRIPS|nr:hypothetical protein T4B_9444 [Trichinella pseudospiralis]